MIMDCYDSLSIFQVKEDATEIEMGIETTFHHVIVTLQEEETAIHVTAGGTGMMTETGDLMTEVVTEGEIKVEGVEIGKIVETGKELETEVGIQIETEIQIKEEHHGI